MRLPDAPAILAGVVLAPVLLVAPGWFWSRLLDLGPLPRSERLAWALLLSLATAPVLAYNFFLLLPYRSWTVWLFALLHIAVPAALSWRRRPPERPGPAIDRRLWLLPALMALLAVTSVMDFQRGDQLWRGHPADDYAKHILVTDAISRTGIHPVNPAFHPGRPLPLFFYLFWFLLSSMLDALSGWRFGARAAVQALTGWGAVALFALTLVAARRLLRPATPRAVGLCFALLFVTGLDLIPVLFWAFVNIEPGRLVWRERFHLYPNLDAWNWVGQVTSWLETAAWAPHHLAACVVGITGLLLILVVPPSRGRAFLFAAAAASLLGLSVWVTLVFAVFWAAWWLRNSGFSPAQAGLPALLAAPFIVQLWRARRSAGFPLVFDVRDFGFWRAYTYFQDLGPWREILDLAWLPLLYSLELGVFALGAWFWWRRRRRVTPPQRAMALLAGVSLLTASLLRSSIHNNDFGWRGLLPAQFALLLATAWMLERLWRLKRRSLLIAACLGLGLAGVAFDWAVMTGYPPAQDLYASRGERGRRNLILKRLYERIRDATPSTAIVQQNPDVGLEIPHAFYAGRQSAVLDRSNGAVFDTAGPEFETALRQVASIFAPAASPDHIEQTARRFGIRVLVVQDTDPAWANPAWQDPRFPLIAASDLARAYRIQ